MSDQCLLLFLYEGLLWRENLRRRGKEACSCFSVKVTGKNIRDGGQLKLSVGQHGWSQALFSGEGV